MQPSYLPWVGYFNLIINSDVFIFLDDVQYSKNSFFNRNKYPAKNSESFCWLTVPVRRASSSQLLNETYLVEDTNWRKKHLTAIKLLYGQEECFSDFFPILEKSIKDESLTTLANINISLIKAICAYLEIDKQFYISSELKISGSRSDRLVTLCKKFGCQIYLSPAGAQDYIEEDNILPPSGIKIIYQNYICKEYVQKGIDCFVPYMSIIDLVFRYNKTSVKRYLFQDLLAADEALR